MIHRNEDEMHARREGSRFGARSTSMQYLDAGTNLLAVAHAYSGAS